MTRNNTIDADIDNELSKLLNDANSDVKKNLSSYWSMSASSSVMQDYRSGNVRVIRL